jgi:hypothetical protein
MRPRAPQIARKTARGLDQLPAKLSFEIDTAEIFSSQLAMTAKRVLQSFRPQYFLHSNDRLLAAADIPVQFVLRFEPQDIGARRDDY